MPLNRDEKKAINELVSSFDQAGFEVFLVMASLAPLSEFSAASNKMPKIVIDFIQWMEAKPIAIIPALEALAQEFPVHPAAAILLLGVDRFKREAALMMPASPWEVALVDGIPVVNRVQLRGLLQSIVNQAGPKVVMVNGPTGTGRSHSFYLINHVAACSAIKLVLVDLNYLPAERRNIRDIVNQLITDLGLAGFQQPDTHGATAATIGGRYAENFAAALKLAAPVHPTWFVFDHLERHQLAEVRAFVAALVDMRLRQLLGSCIFFLLGAGSEYVFNDQFRRIETEQLGIFSDTEIEAYVHTLNGLGRSPLAPAMLAARARDIKLLLKAVPVHQVCGEVARKISDLRVEVRA